MRSCITSEALHHGLQGLTRVAAQPAFAGILLASCPLASHGAPPPGTVNGTSSLSTVIHHAASQERDLVAAEATVSRVAGWGKLTFLAPREHPLLLLWLCRCPWEEQPRPQQCQYNGFDNDLPGLLLAHSGFVAMHAG